MNRVPAPPPHFHEALKSQSIELDPGDEEKLTEFLSHLLHVNQQFNLTAIKDPAEAWVKHIADSLSLLPFLMALEAKQVADIGSGGGLPGIPLAIAMPGTHFSLIESTGKKARFLSEAVQRLGLKNVTVLTERIEEAAAFRRKEREGMDAVTCRAVGQLASIIELAVPLLKVGGVLLAIKGERAPQEIAASDRALELLHAKVDTTTRTPTGTIVAVVKLAKTSRLYPRDQGLPSRKPLGIVEAKDAGPEPR
ncbi:MAG: 16S rRNA (guanine(527)-N(7))-methyltransferase RsmG [Planctomycetes bacterium]|nr:16S rRNA (guanine(527)-N(7))-methyltransferase RsmG [Planctomycetota bacterium]